MLLLGIFGDSAKKRMQDEIDKEVNIQTKVQEKNHDGNKGTANKEIVQESDESKLEKKLLANNLTIALESDLNPDEMKNFLKNVNNQFIKVNYDMGNSAFWSFDIKKEFLYYGQLISNVHIKDCTPKDYTVPLGSGNVDFIKVLQLLKDNNYEGDFILQASRSKNNIQTAKEQLKFSKDFISKYFL